MNLRVNVFLGALTVGRECDVTSMVLNYPIGSASRYEVAASISSMTPRGHTPLDQRLRMTKDMFSDKVNKKLVFLLSDGMDTCGDIPDLCGTAALLAANGIDLSVFSFINETLDEESRSAYAIYQCMVRPTTNRIYKIDQMGGVADEIDYKPVSNNILRLPSMDTSALWHNNPVLFQFPISRIELEADDIIRLGDQ
jgi:Ca-activated chloride channel family protein